jgi:GTPase Era involved in 16S rRNA processing
VDARADLEKFFGKQIHIELYVKVNKMEKQREHVKSVLDNQPMDS